MYRILNIACATGLDGIPPNIPGVPAGVLLVIETPAQGREIVNRLAAARVDLVKVRNGLSRETYSPTRPSVGGCPLRVIFHRK